MLFFQKSAFNAKFNAGIMCDTLAKEHRSCPGRNHFVTELSRTCFEKSLIYQLLPFAFDDQSGGILVLLKKKKKKKKKKLRLSRSLPFSLSTRLSNTMVLSFFF